MPEEEEREGEELREEAPVYFERYQQAREEYLAAELRRLEEAIGHNADRIRDSRDLMELRFQQVDRRFVELRADIDQRFTASERHIDEQFAAVDQRFAAVDQRFESVDQRFDSLERQMDHRFQDIKAGLQRSDRWTQVFFGTTLAFLVAILALVGTLLIR